MVLSLQRKNPLWLEKKLVKPDFLEEKMSALRQRSLTIATLNGSFDLMHAGHLYILHQASLQADILLVLLNSDASIQRYKGSKRPFINLQHRLEMMAALEFVNFVSWFEEDDPREALAKIRPDVHVNGKEYGLNCVEADVVHNLGGRIHLVDRIGSLSTTKLMEKIVS